MAYARQRISVVSRTHRPKETTKGRTTQTKRVASRRNTNVKNKRTATRI